MRTVILLLALLAGTGAYAAPLPLYVDAVIDGESVQRPSAEHFELDYRTLSPRFTWFCVTIGIGQVSRSAMASTPPTNTASPWCSPACAISAIERIGLVKWVASGSPVPSQFAHDFRPA